MSRTTYWRTRWDDGQLRGLFRRIERDNAGSLFAYLGEKGWVSDQTLFRWWLDPGDRDLVEISREQAEAVTSAAGIDLDALANEPEDAAH